MNKPSISVPAFGMPQLPYQWDDNDLSFQLNATHNIRVQFASMGSISESIWVPENWKEQSQGGWRRLRNLFMDVSEDWRKDYRLHDFHGTGRIPAGKRLKEGKKLDHWYLRTVMGVKGVPFVLGQHNRSVECLVNQIQDNKSDDCPAEITPDEYDRIKSCLQVFHVPREHWSDEDLEGKYRELHAFLTKGKSWDDSVNLDERHLPNLTDMQAAHVLWAIDGIFEVDSHDIRFGPCPACGDMVRHANEVDECMFHCEGCGVSVCESCRPEFGGSSEHEDWDEKVGTHSECFCRKCCELIERQLDEARKDRTEP